VLGESPIISRRDAGTPKTCAQWSSGNGSGFLRGRLSPLNTRSRYGASPISRSSGSVNPDGFVGNAGEREPRAAHFLQPLHHPGKGRDARDSTLA